MHCDFVLAKLGQMLTKLWDTSFWYVAICSLKIDTKCYTFLYRKEGDILKFQVN